MGRAAPASRRDRPRSKRTSSAARSRSRAPLRVFPRKTAPTRSSARRRKRRNRNSRPPKKRSSGTASPPPPHVSIVRKRRWCGCNRLDGKKRNDSAARRKRSHGGSPANRRSANAKRVKKPNDLPANRRSASAKPARMPSGERPLPNESGVNAWRPNDSPRNVGDGGMIFWCGGFSRWHAWLVRPLLSLRRCGTSLTGVRCLEEPCANHIVRLLWNNSSGTWWPFLEKTTPWANTR